MWINGELQTKTTPAIFARLLAEDYEVRLELKGYLPWKEDLEVRSGETTFAAGVRMIRDELPRLISTEDSAEARWNDASGQMVSVRDDATGTKNIVVRDSTGTETVLARFPALTHKAVSLAWSPDGKNILTVVERSDSTTELLILGLDAGQAFSRSLKDSFISGRLTAHWMPDGKIAVTARNGVFVATAEGVISMIASGSGFGDAVSDGKSWFAIRNELAKSSIIQVDKINQPIVSTLPKGAWRFTDGGVDPLIAVDADRGRMAISQGIGSIPTVIEASHAERAPDGKSLLVWNDFEIAIFNVAGKERTTVTRIGAIISGATRLNDGSIVFSTPSGIALLQPRLDGYRDAIDLVRFTGIGPFHIPPSSAVLQFFGVVGSKGGLYERTL